MSDYVLNQVAQSVTVVVFSGIGAYLGIVLGDRLTGGGWHWRYW